MTEFELSADAEETNLDVDILSPESLFSGPTLKLGWVHWYLVKAYAESFNKMTHRVPMRQDGSGPCFVKATDFSKEVGADFIHWWVFKREEQVDRLQENTSRVLRSVQKLKEASAELRIQSVQSYEELIFILKAFVESHASEINDLYQYVVWLHDKDVLAPCILFSYRVWGSTRRADRLTEVSASKPNAENPRVIKRLSEIALGLVQGGLYAIDLVYYDIGSEIYSSKLGEREEDEVVDVPMDEVYVQTSRRVLDEFAVYFEFLRNSLRNIILEIEEYNIAGETTPIERFVIDQPVRVDEDRQYEFKDVSESKKPANSIKNTADEYVVAFLNSGEGGSIYWGVQDPDRKVEGVNLNYRERDEVRRVVSQKLNEIRPAIDPTAYRLRFHSVRDDNGNAIPDLYVVEIAVPRLIVQEPYYTGGNEAFVRIDGVKAKLSGPALTDWIKRRLTNQQ